MKINLETLNINNSGDALQKHKYLSEFNTDTEKKLAVKNLGLRNTVLITEDNYDALDKNQMLNTNSIYFIIPNKE